MTRLPRLVASAALAGLVGMAPPARAERPESGVQAEDRPLGRLAVVSNGALQGVVTDDRGAPLRGVIISALGPASFSAVTDQTGCFTFVRLPAGPYLVRAHLAGFSSGQTRFIDIKPGATVPWAITMRRASAAIGAAGEGPAPEILSAGFAEPPDRLAPRAGEPLEETPEATASDHDHSEFAWRLRHLKRSVLKDADIGALVDDGSADETAGAPSLFGRAMHSSARFASTLFGDFPLSGQFNLLTTASLDNPLQLLSEPSVSRSVAYLSLGAAAGSHGDWAVRGAVTQGDVASWILAGSYLTRAPAAHVYELGMSYSTQRYDGGNAAALAAVRDGARNAGSVYGFDTWTVSRAVAVGYGARYSRYDYLVGPGLLSPRLSVTLTPVDRWRVRTLASRHRLAPGAEEFAPSMGAGLWLPPERTFAPMVAGGRFVPEQTAHYEIAVEREVSGASVIRFRTFYQQVDDQLVTLFGLRLPDRPAAALGHYFVATGGNLTARGWSVGLTHAMANRVRGSVDYTVTTARWHPSVDTALITRWAPSASRRANEQIHDVTTSVETEIPETATRVFVIYKFNNAFVRRDLESDRPAFDARFDVQVRQSLPFLNFTNARWEMLVAVRNLFRETLADQSVYDELLVVRPPKRVVGGLLVRF